MMWIVTLYMTDKDIQLHVPCVKLVRSAEVNDVDV